MEERGLTMSGWITAEWEFGSYRLEEMSWNGRIPHAHPLLLFSLYRIVVDVCNSDCMEYTKRGFQNSHGPSITPMDYLSVWSGGRREWYEWISLPFPPSLHLPLLPFQPWSFVYTQLQCIFLASPRNKEIEKGHDLNGARWHERGVALGCKLEAVQSSPLIYPWVSSHRLPSMSLSPSCCVSLSSSNRWEGHAL